MVKRGPGRPRLADPRDNKIMIRLSDAGFAQLKAGMQMLGTSTMVDAVLYALDRTFNVPDWQRVQAERGKKEAA